MLRATLYLSQATAHAPCLQSFGSIACSTLLSEPTNTAESSSAANHAQIWRNHSQLGLRHLSTTPTCHTSPSHKLPSSCCAGVLARTSRPHLKGTTPGSLVWQQHLGTQSQGGASSTPKASPTQAADSLWTPPNMLSIGRAISGPFISYLILAGNWPWALTATAISGLTDWADGALARHLKQTSIIGSYLDPLADKVLVACVVGALAWEGHAPAWVALLVVGRDVGLVTGMALHRWRALGWRVRGVTAAEFFSTGASAGVPLMKPLMISKVNTVLQLALVCGCMTHAWVQAPDAPLLHQLELLTASTTAASLGAYMWQYATGKLLPLPTEQKA